MTNYHLSGDRHHVVSLVSWRNFYSPDSVVKNNFFAKTYTLYEENFLFFFISWRCPISDHLFWNIPLLLFQNIQDICFWFSDHQVHLAISPHLAITYLLTMPYQWSFIFKHSPPPVLKYSKKLFLVFFRSSSSTTTSRWRRVTSTTGGRTSPGPDSHPRTRPTSGRSSTTTSHPRWTSMTRVVISPGQHMNGQRARIF